MIIVINGKSGSGKDYTAKYIADKYNYKFIPLVTNRAIRYGEINKKDYEFVTTDAIINFIKNDMFIEYRAYYTLYNGIPDVWYYGTLKTNIKDNEKYIIILDKEGYLKIKKHYKDRVISIFVDTTDEIRYLRAFCRTGFDKTEFNRRLKSDNKVFNDLSIYDYIIENNSTKKELEKQIDKIIKEIGG